jgi:hypothetical protein
MLYAETGKTKSNEFKLIAISVRKKIKIMLFQITLPICPIIYNKTNRIKAICRS